VELGMKSSLSFFATARRGALDFFGYRQREA
jgi:hypothetical protein